MTKPIIRIHNTDNDEVIDREMTDQEYQDYLLDLERIEIQKKEIAEKSVQRQELLGRLGITEEEAQLLLGGK
jgi:hypothetical protein